MKRRNPFRTYQQISQSARENLLQELFATLSRTRLRFENLTELAQHAADHLSLAQGIPCSRSTLLRNPRYKALLIVNFGRLSRSNKGSKRDVSPISTSDLEIGNLRAEILRLKAYIGTLESLRQGGAISDGRSREVQESANELGLICKAFYLMLETMSAFVVIDREHRRVLDLSKTRDNVIVSGDVVAPFFRWLDENQPLL